MTFEEILPEFFQYHQLDQTNFKTGWHLQQKAKIDVTKRDSKKRDSSISTENNETK